MFFVLRKVADVCLCQISRLLCRPQIYCCPDTGMMEPLWVPEGSRGQTEWFGFCNSTGTLLLLFTSQEHESSFYCRIDDRRWQICLGHTCHGQPYLRSTGYRSIHSVKGIGVVGKDHKQILVLVWALFQVTWKSCQLCYCFFFGFFSVATSLTTVLGIFEIFWHFVQNNGVYGCMLIE